MVRLRTGAGAFRAIRRTEMETDSDVNKRPSANGVNTCFYLSIKFTSTKIIFNSFGWYAAYADDMRQIKRKSTRMKKTTKKNSQIHFMCMWMEWLGLVTVAVWPDIPISLEIKRKYTIRIFGI